MNYCLLYHSVYDRWYSKHTFPAVRLWYLHPTDSLWFVCSASQTVNLAEHKGAGAFVRSVLCIGKDTVSSNLRFAVLPGFTHTVIAGCQLGRILGGRCRGLVRFCRCLCQECLDIGTEGIHALAVLREPVHDIAVVRCNALPVALAVADDVLFGQTVLLAEVGTKFNGLLIHLFEVGAISKTVLTDFKADMGVVCRAACVLAAMIPRKSLVSCHRAISQLANEGVDANLSVAGVIGVPVIAVLVFAQLAVIGTDIAFQPGVVRTSGMYHDALDRDFPAGLVAGVFGENKFIQIHYRL